MDERRYDLEVYIYWDGKIDRRGGPYRVVEIDLSGEEVKVEYMGDIVPVPLAWVDQDSLQAREGRIL